MSILSIIEEKISEAVKLAGAESDYFEIEIPRHENQGDISTPAAMALAKRLKKPPREIAAQIVSAINGEDVFDSIEIAGPGFINFKLSKNFLIKGLRQIQGKETDFFRPDIGKGKRIQIEFVSANPTGPLHLGHGRGAALGDSLANILDAAGYQVVKEFYVNDAGRQVFLLGESVFVRYMESCGAHIDFPEDGYQGDYIKEIAAKIKSEKGDIFKEKAFNQVSDFFIDFSYKEMLENIKKDLKTFRVVFDSWQSERSLFSNNLVDETIEYLKDRSFIYESEGALWFRASSMGDEKDRVVKKSNGDYTYFASDISYHDLKFKKDFDEVINIWGADHHGYIARIKTVLGSLGHDESKLKTLLVQMVALLRGGKPVQMSKRSGEFVTLKEVIDEVGPDIARFIFLTRRSDSHLEFDLDVVKKESSENPVFYIQYAYARISSIFKKAEEEGFDTDQGTLESLTEPEEWRVIRKLIFYPFMLQGAVRTLEPHRVTFYLQELSSLFHQYYNKCRVISDDRDLTSARLTLCACIGTVLGQGLGLLGISAPERM